MTEKFKPPFIRDRRVILEDIYECERRLKDNPDDKTLKRALKECNDELGYTKPSLMERLFKR